MKRSKSVDEYIRNTAKWRDELCALRDVLKSTDLKEEVKWGMPCYTYHGKNVVGLVAFKSYFGLWFYQGALLRDTKKYLVNAQQGVTKAMRQWRMTSRQEIKPAVVRHFVEESIRSVDAGVEVKMRRVDSLVVPPELKNALRRQKGATRAYRDLRPGVQREYARYITTAKRAETKRNRIAKILPMIVRGEGLNDKYRQ